MHKEQLMQLLDKMTLTEKVMQMTQLRAGMVRHTQPGEVSGDYGTRMLSNEELYATGSILGVHDAQYLIQTQKEYLESSRCKIPLLFANDVIHGYRTIFPIPLAQGCSFDPELIRDAAEITARETAVAGFHVTYSPMADLVRDPRWGRIMESPGEDPYLVGLVTEATVQGYQGDDPSAPGRIAACVKHFAGYGQPEGGREYNTVDMSRGVLRDFYLPGYKKGIDAGAAMVMSSYNVVDRVPASCSEYLLQQILREEWGFPGVVISDYDSIGQTIPHGAAGDAFEAGEKCIQAGVDMDMMSGIYAVTLKTLVENGSVSMKQLDAAVLRILELKNKLGLFENPYKDADPELEKQLHCCPEHRAVARKLAVRSMVLLKNENVLPLTADRKLGLAGPMAKTRKLLGAWAEMGRFEDTVTVETGLRAVLGDRLVTAMTAELPGDDREDVPDETEQALETFRDCDICVVAVGQPSWSIGEGASKTDLRLSTNQEKLIRCLKAAGKTVVTVVFSGRPLELAPILDSSDAVLQAWFPGTEGGNAVADLLFGKENPTGRLSMTFPRDKGQIPIYYNRYNTGRPSYSLSYRDCQEGPLFPFGYGLTYTQFKWSSPQIRASGQREGKPAHCLEDGELTVSIGVKNTGDREGEPLVQLYLRDVSASVVRPVKELKGFRRITLKPGEEQTVSFVVDQQMLSFYNNRERFVFEPGWFDIMLGDNSHDLQTQRIWIE